MAGDEAVAMGADKALAEAMRGGDKAAARRLLSLQFTYVDADGEIHARREFLAGLKGVAAAPASEIAARSYGLITIISGRRRSSRGDDVFVLDIWAKQKGAWRALLIQEVALGATEAAASPTPPTEGLQNDECNNPCQTIPYRVRSTAEQDIVNTLQMVVKAIVAHNADDWAKHVADEFMLYASGRAPFPKSGRVAAIGRQKEANAAAVVGDVQTMRLSVYGDGALMTTSEAAPDHSRPPYRAARVWVRRDGQWLLALSAHTDVK